MAEEKELEIKYIPPPPVDILVINGVRYSGQLFRAFSGFEIGACLQIIKREDGVVNFRRIPAPLEAEEKEGSHEN